MSTFATNEYPKEYIPTVFENHETTFNVDNKDYCLTLWDTAGQEDFEKLRLLSYPKVNFQVKKKKNNNLLCYFSSDQLFHSLLFDCKQGFLQKY